MHCHVTTAAAVVFNQMPQLAAVVQQDETSIDCTFPTWMVGLDTSYLCAEFRIESAVFHDSLFALQKFKLQDCDNLFALPKKNGFNITAQNF